MRGRLWTEAERDEIRRRRVSGEQWVAIGASYGVSGDAARRAAGAGGFSIQAVGMATERVVVPSSPSAETHSQAPFVHTSKSRAENYLVISDLQIPYHHPGALEFCKAVRFEFSIPLDNVLCVGDEVDQYWASRFDRVARAPHTAEQEIEESRKELARWAVAFPHMRLCYSNHGDRFLRKADRDGFPRSVLRDFRDVLGTPPTWVWADHWIVKASRHPFRVEHGHVRPGGHNGLRQRPVNRGISTAWGHEHAEPASIHVDTAGGQKVWGLRVGSLLTTEPVPAFDYNAEDASRPVGSVGVVLDGGRTPLVVRM